MLRPCLLALALSGASSAALAHPQGPLPDFPTAVAQPGECWARRPVGHAPVAAPRGQAVWTLERGQGPGAVWNYSEAPAAPALAHSGPLEWVPVDCRSGDTVRYAEAPPHHGHHIAPPSPPSSFHTVPPPPPRLPPVMDGGPYADPRPAPPVFHPEPHPPSLHAGHTVGAYPDPLGGPPPMLHHRPAPFLHLQHPPLRPFPAPQFGARFLHWPGKTLR